MRSIEPSARAAIAWFFCLQLRPSRRPKPSPPGSRIPARSDKLKVPAEKGTKKLRFQSLTRSTRRRGTATFPFSLLGETSRTSPASAPTRYGTLEFNARHANCHVFVGRVDWLLHIPGCLGSPEFSPGGRGNRLRESGRPRPERRLRADYSAASFRRGAIPLLLLDLGADPNPRSTADRRSAVSGPGKTLDSTDPMRSDSGAGA